MAGIEARSEFVPIIAGGGGRHAEPLAWHANARSEYFSGLGYRVQRQAIIGVSAIAASEWAAATAWKCKAPNRDSVTKRI
jgi:hypothetical protein